MSTKYTKLSAKYNQLSAEERWKIETYYKLGVSISKIFHHQNEGQKRRRNDGRNNENA